MTTDSEKIEIAKKFLTPCDETGSEGGRKRRWDLILQQTDASSTMSR
jgi:hypothetical protein